MSLFIHRRAIARAAAGELPEPAERRLRAHLRRCDACRAHYDHLSRVADALAAERLGGDAEAGPVARVDAGRAAAARERARLVAALSLDALAPTAAATPPGRARRSTSIGAALLLVPATLGVWFFFLRPARDLGPRGGPDAGGVTWRGGLAEEPGPPAALLIFASRKAGERGDTAPGKPSAKDPAPPMHVRLIADLPASGEGKVSRQDFVQFVLRGLQTSAFVTVIGIDDAGELHTYVPRPGSAPQRREPSSAAISLGASIDLAAGHRPGRLRLYALLPAAPLDAARIRAAAGRIDLSRPGAPPLDLSVPQVAGVLTIEP